MRIVKRKRLTLRNLSFSSGYYLKGKFIFLKHKVQQIISILAMSKIYIVVLSMLKIYRTCCFCIFLLMFKFGLIDD